MFKLFKKPQTEIVNMDYPQQELVKIEIRDVKQYLINEFDRSRGLENQISCLESEIENYKELQIKYDATLVLIDEFDKRVLEKENIINQLKQKIEHKNNEIKNINDNLNNYIITNKELTKPAEKLKEEIWIEVKQDYQNMVHKIIKDIKSVKGNLSKEKAIEFINELL